MTPADDSEGTPPDKARGDDDVVEPTPAADPGESPATGSGAEEIPQETDAPPAAEAPAESDSSADAGGEADAQPEQPAEATSEAEQEAAAPDAEQETAAPEAEQAAPEAASEQETAAPEAEQAAPEAASEPEQGAAPPPERATAPEAEHAAPPEAAADSEPSAESEQAAAERRRRAQRGRGGEREETREEVVPGAHLEPDLVLDEPQAGEDEFAQYAVEDEEPAPEQAATGEQEQQTGPVARTPMDLAADARYRATGKRKSAVARVILRPGGGNYRINGRELADFFPRQTLRVTARQPLDAAGYSQRMDVVAKIHGGGVSSQAGALRHGIARALVEADPNLRAELKRRGFLTRDARQKERKKAGLKKARKRPQFSKR